MNKSFMMDFIKCKQPLCGLKGEMSDGHLTSNKLIMWILLWWTLFWRSEEVKWWKIGMWVCVSVLGYYFLQHCRWFLRHSHKKRVTSSVCLNALLLMNIYSCSMCPLCCSWFPLVWLCLSMWLPFGFCMMWWVDKRYISKW